MKVCLYLEAEKAVAKSGFRRAYQSHLRAMKRVGIDVVSDPSTFDYDVLHIHAFGPRSLRFVGLAKQRGIKVVIHAHSVGAHDFRDSYTLSNLFAPVYERFLKYVYEKADAIFTPTPFAKRMLHELGISQPVFAISNGVDLDRFSFSHSSRDRYRKKFGLERFTAFGAGLIIPRKGITEFIDIGSDLPQHQFIWFGHRWAKTLAFHPRMDQHVAQRPENVIMAGYVEDPHEAFCAGDVLLFTSRTETQGMVLLEAAALGRPIVVRDLPEYEDWLVDNHNCLKARTNTEFAEQTDRIANDENLYAKLAENGIATAREHSIDHIGEELKRLYRSVLKEEEIISSEFVQSGERSLS